MFRETLSDTERSLVELLPRISLSYSSPGATDIGLEAALSSETIRETV